MCQICKDWKSGKIDSKTAYKQITKLLKNPIDSKTNNHLLQLSDRILDEDVPLPPTNEEAESAFWHATHKQVDEE